MGRNPRIHYPGAIYHAMARGVDGRAIYSTDADRTAFLDILRRGTNAALADILAYCLMGNHFHLAIRVGQIPLSAIMQRTLGGYARPFNERNERTGHLFQARYKACLCLDDRYLAGLIRYIHMNPVRAKLVATPQDWPWSSFKPGPDDSVNPLDFDPWPKDATRNFDLTRDLETPRTDLAALAVKIESQTGVSPDELRSASRRRTAVAAKALLAQEAIKNGHRLIEIARWLNSTQSSLTRYSQKILQIPVGLTPNTIKRPGV